MGILLPDALADLRPELVGQLDLSIPGENIRHIEAPAIDIIGGFQPLFQDRIFASVHGLPQRIGSVVQGRHGIQVPPAVVGVVLLEEIVAPLHRIRIVVSALGLIEILPVPIEPAVSRAGVVDGDIQDQLHAVFVEGAAQVRQGLVPAEMGVHVEIIQAVILMAGGGIENGIQVQGRDTQLLQIGDLLLNTLEVAAVEVHTVGLLVAQGLIFPVPMKALVAVLRILAGPDIVARVTVAETLREDLVEHRILDPGGLDIVADQLKIIDVLRQIGGDLLLGIKINLLPTEDIEVVAHPVLFHPHWALPIDEGPLGISPHHILLQLSAVGGGAQDHQIHRRVGVHPQANGHRLEEFGGRIRHKGGRAVGIHTFQPGFHSFSIHFHLFCCVSQKPSPAGEGKKCFIDNRSYPSHSRLDSRRYGRRWYPKHCLWYGPCHRT